MKGHYYAGKQKGYKYLNDTYILNVNTNRWSVRFYLCKEKQNIRNSSRTEVRSYCHFGRIKDYYFWRQGRENCFQGFTRPRSLDFNMVLRT